MLTVPVPVIDTSDDDVLSVTVRPSMSRLPLLASATVLANVTSASAPVPGVENRAALSERFRNAKPPTLFTVLSEMLPDVFAPPVLVSMTRS